MDSTSLAVFRFKVMDGVIAGLVKNCANETQFTSNGKTYSVVYNGNADNASLYELDSLTDERKLMQTIALKALKETLTSLGLYKERTSNRHLLSYEPFEFQK